MHITQDELINKQNHMDEKHLTDGTMRGWTKIYIYIYIIRSRWAPFFQSDVACPTPRWQHEIRTRKWMNKPCKWMIIILCKLDEGLHSFGLWPTELQFIILRKSFCVQLPILKPWTISTFRFIFRPNAPFPSFRGSLHLFHSLWILYFLCSVS